MKHTPTPWQRGNNLFPDRIFDLKEREIAYCGGQNTSGTANAKHIVHCVNMHDELVEALDDMIKYLDNNGKESDVSELARQALSKAKEKEQ